MKPRTSALPLLALATLLPLLPSPQNCHRRTARPLGRHLGHLSRRRATTPKASSAPPTPPTARSSTSLSAARTSASSSPTSSASTRSPSAPPTSPSAPGGSDIDLASASALTFGGRPSITIPPEPSSSATPPTSSSPPSPTSPSASSSPRSPCNRSRTTASPTRPTTPPPATSSAPKPWSRPTEIYNWPFLKGVDVLADGNSASIVAFGDSITDGALSTRNANARWPDVLARRLQANKKTADLGVLNEGIGGNRILHDITGPNALARFDRDVLAQAGVKYLIILESINDIGHATDPDQTLRRRHRRRPHRRPRPTRHPRPHPRHQGHTAQPSPPTSEPNTRHPPAKPCAKPSTNGSAPPINSTASSTSTKLTQTPPTPASFSRRRLRRPPPPRRRRLQSHGRLHRPQTLHQQIAPLKQNEEAGAKACLFVYVLIPNQLARTRSHG